MFLEVRGTGKEKISSLGQDVSGKAKIQDLFPMSKESGHSLERTAAALVE